MKTCRVCGMTGDWDWADTRNNLEFFHQRYPNAPHYLFDSHVCYIAELCWHCNYNYNQFYRRAMSRPMIERDERILVEFVAHRLHILARRYAAGQSITLCQAMKRKARDGIRRCCNWWSKEIDGHQLCTSHAQAFKRGSLTAFAHDDGTWLEEVTAFFRASSGPP